MHDTIHVSIVTVPDVEQARRDVRRFAVQHGFGAVDAERLVLVVSELGMNLVHHAGHGELNVETTCGHNGSTQEPCGIQVTSTDHGPGIDDLEQAMADGFSTRGGLGSGLPGVRRLMDTFDIQSGRDGTRVVVSLWPTDRS